MLLHHSHDEAYRFPVGAIPAGGVLRLRFFCDETETIILRTWDGRETRVPMEQVDLHLFEASITLPQIPMLFWYDFIILTEQEELRYGNRDDMLGGEGTLQYGHLHSYQVTVYDPAFQTPDYLHKAVIYQIFPDRFYKGAKDEADRTEKINAAHPEAFFHQNWQEAPLLDIDPANGDNRALDFFGGTLEGIRQKLDTLRAMGVTVLYLNPIFRARTNHRYDTGSYEEIDPIVGNEEAFYALMRSAHERGMRVLLDGVFSHTGADSLYFNRFGHYDTVGAYQSQESLYYDWYHFDEFPDRYRAWWGIYTLPAVNKEHPEYQEYLLDPQKGVLPRWVRRGACGWRLDVADELPIPMLQRMRTAVKAADPDAVLVGEVWEDASNKVAYGALRSYCLGDTVDSVMNYPLRRAVIDFFTGVLDAYGLCRVILHQREVYPPPFHYALMNLLGSHDRVRILNAMAGYDKDGIIQMPREEAAGIRLAHRQLALSKKRHLAALTLLSALPGAPTVYYGDELGMQGMSDPWNRAPMDWDGGDKSHRAAVSAILTMRQKNCVLQTGFLDVSAADAHTLRIRRYAVDGKDVFGQPLLGADVLTEVSRN